MNPLYNGWVRHRRSERETLKPAPQRANPPVSDELCARVEEARRFTTCGGGPKNLDRVDLLGGLLVCMCGRRLGNNGTFAGGRHRNQNANPCESLSAATRGKPNTSDWVGTSQVTLRRPVEGRALRRQNLAGDAAHDQLELRAWTAQNAAPFRAPPPRGS
jgi:hypothetical protein